jgi:hypothetical protein
MMDIGFPSVSSAVSEIRRFNKKYAKGKASVAMSSGVICITATRYNDDEDEIVNEVRFQITKANIQNIIDELQSMLDIMKGFKQLVKDL